MCRDSIYIVGGYYEKARGHFSVLTCPVARVMEEAETQPEWGVATPWYKITDLPVCRSTCITFRGKLAVLGGRMVNGYHSAAMYLYSPTSDNWMHISDMLQARSECHAAVIGEKRIVVVGGYTDGGITDDVETADIHML